jgi:hypothetical protein
MVPEHWIRSQWPTFVDVGRVLRNGAASWQLSDDGERLYLCRRNLTRVGELFRKVCREQLQNGEWKYDDGEIELLGLNRP